MKTTILRFPSVSARLAELGCPFPDGLALLPTNFETASSPADFLQVSEAATVKTLFRIANLPQSDLVPKAQRPPYIQNNSFEWVAPTIFVSAALLTDHANYVSVALSVIANYATDFFKGMSGKKTVKLEVVVEQTKTRICKRLVYEGDVDGLKEIPKIVREMGDE
jgi:hypothetical protein